MMNERVNIGASYPEPPEGMTPGEFAQALFEATFPEGVEPRLDLTLPRKR